LEALELNAFDVDAGNFEFLEVSWVKRVEFLGVGCANQPSLPKAVAR
jgi:hypothetical protein